MTDCNKEGEMSFGISSGYVGPSDRRYRVVFAHEHYTLAVGDVVVMVLTPSNDDGTGGGEFFLLRESDMTLHCIDDGDGQFVHLKSVND